MLAMINGLKAALQDGELSMERVNEAVAHIIALKMQYLCWLLGISVPINVR